jgi:hypothetical protein
MTLPDYSQQFNPLPNGDYIFQIHDMPTVRKGFGQYGDKVAIRVPVRALPASGGDTIESNLLLFPWDVAYKDLKEVIGSRDEQDWVGKKFRGRIENIPNPKKPNRMLQNLFDVEPFDTTPTPEEMPEPDADEKIEEERIEEEEKKDDEVPW